MRALILAGGRSSRFGGIDKTFALLRGRPLIEHVIERVAPQVEALAISSNVAPERFQYLGFPVIADVAPDVAGPLAGIFAGLTAWPEEELLTVAVDLPFLPRDLASRLHTARASYTCAAASDGERHAAAILWAPHAAETLGRFLHEGHRSLKKFIAAHGCEVAFPPTESDDITFNINTPADLAAAESRLLR